nr:hypothetical protein [Mycoplasmopsis bovis]
MALKFMQLLKLLQIEKSLTTIGKKGIANRDPYQSTIVNKLVSVEVTDELRKSTVNKALTSGDGEGLFDGTFFKVIDELINKDNDPLDVAEGVLKQNSQIWENNLFRYKELLDSDNVVKFLKPGKDLEYKDIVEKKGGFKTPKSKIHLINS